MRIGILGGGQLGRMLSLAASSMGLRTTVYDPAPDCCAGEVCPNSVGAFEDLAALDRFASSCDLITYEFESLPLASVQHVAQKVPVFPPPTALEVGQDRITEKSYLRDLGIPTPPFLPVDDRESLEKAVKGIGLPGILKTRRFGYDGKGQAVLKTAADIEFAWNRLGGSPLIYEGFIPFDRELSSIAVRGQDGEMGFYPLVENQHIDGILHRSLAPASATGEELSERAQEFLRILLNELDYVGVLTVEWFQDGAQLLANEIAPRVHNSGHWTLEGAITSQFENHLRAVGRLPLGPCAALGRSAMFNFIGGTPPMAEVLRDPHAKFHHYGKENRPGRKVGHVTLRATNDEFDELLPRWNELFARCSTQSG